MTETSGFVSSVLINTVFAVLILSLFCYLRPRYQWIYEPRLTATKRKNAPAPPNPGKGWFFSWFFAVWRTSDAELISTAGLDAAVFVKFFSLCCKFFAIASVFGCLILIPINATGENTAKSSSDREFVQGFEALSMSGVENGSSRLWAHLIISYAYMLLLFYILNEVWQFYQQQRFQFLSQQYKQGRGLSLLQHNLPKELQTREALLDHWREECGPENVADVTLVVDTGKLSDYVTEREDILAELEHCYAVWEANQRLLPLNDKNYNKRPQKALTCFCFNRVDAIDYHTQQINRLNTLIAHEKAKQHPTFSSAIISFNSVTAMTEAYLRHNQVKSWCPVLVSRQIKSAPEPRDVVWRNMRFDAVHKTIRRVIAATITLWLVVFWIIPVTFAQGLANLKALGSQLHIQSAVDAMPTVAISLIQGYLPGLIVIAFFIVLPLILRVFSDQIQGVESESWIQKAVLSKYFLFQLINNFLFLTAASSIFGALDSMVNNPSSIPNFLGISIPQTATYFVTYVLLQALGIFPLAMLNIGRLIVGNLKKIYLVQSERELDALEACPPPDYGTMFSFHLIIFVIGICYAPIAPIVLPFCTIFFGIGYIISKYQTLFLYNPVFETGGTFWPVVFNRLIAATVVANLTLIGLLGLKQVAAPAALSVPLPFLTMSFWLYIHYKYNYECELLPLPECRLIDQQRKHAGAMLNCQVKNAQQATAATFKSADTTQVRLTENSLYRVLRDDSKVSRAPSTLQTEAQSSEEAERVSLQAESTTVLSQAHARAKTPFLDTYVQKELAAEKSIQPPTSAAMTKTAIEVVV